MGTSDKTLWLKACAEAIQECRTIFVINTKTVYTPWDGRMSAIVC